MGTFLHSAAPVKERHAIHNLTYADAAHRILGTEEGSGITLTAANLYQIAKQNDDNTLWMLTDEDPITWLFVGGGTSTNNTLDIDYNNSEGASLITVDAGDITWKQKGAYSTVFDLTETTLTEDGLHIENDADFYRLDRAAADQIAFTSELQTYDLNVAGALTIDSLSTFSIDGVGASNVSATSGNLTLSTLTSGELKLVSAGLLTLLDGFKAGSTYATDLVLSDASDEWNTFETNFGEVSLLNALNQCGTHFDHGALTGLGYDDHTQYALLAGRVGGQIIRGSTGATDGLILRATSGVGASGSDIIFQVGNNGATEAGRILYDGTFIFNEVETSWYGKQNFISTLPTPAGFAWTSIPFSIYKISGIYRTSIDWTNFKPTTAKKIRYVDVALGNDSNAGDAWGSGNAWKSISKALTESAADSDITLVYVMAGYYNYTYCWNNTNVGHDIAFVSYGGTVISSGGLLATSLTWTPDVTYPNVYYTTRSATSFVIDHADLTSYGVGKKLTVQTSVANVDANPGSYYVSGSTVYVRTFDSRSPDVNIEVILGVNGPTLNGAYNYYIEGFEFRSGNSAFILQYATRGVFYNCKFKYSLTANGLTTTDCSDIRVYGCSAYENYLDGFNYHTTLRVVEDNCSAYSNGHISGTGSNNGSSIHENNIIVRVSCTYADNNGPQIADIVTADSWNVGCSVADPYGVSGWQDTGYYSEGNQWLHECVSSGCTYDIYEAGAETTYIYDCVYNTSFGTLSAYAGVDDTYTVTDIASEGILTSTLNKMSTFGSIVVSSGSGYNIRESSLVFDASNVLRIPGGIAPSTSPADAVQLWSADLNGAAGYSSLYLRTEQGTVHAFGDWVGLGTTDLDNTPARGRLTVKGSTNDGTTNVLVGRDSDEANVFWFDSNGKGTFNGGLTDGTATLLAGAWSAITTIAMSGDLTLTAGGSFLSTANGDISISPDGTGTIKPTKDIFTDRWTTASTYNTGIGVDVFGNDALTHASGSEGWYNSGYGFSSLYSITSGYFNVSNGAYAGYSNTTGYNNTFLGGRSGYGNLTTHNDTYVGYYAGRNLTGSYNTVLGATAATGSASASAITGVTCLGFGAGVSLLTGGDYNILIGYQAGDNITTGNNCIIIGNDVDAPSATTNYQLNIGNVIYGTINTALVGIGTSSPSSRLDLQQAGTVEVTTNILELTNSGNAAAMTGTGTGILFNQYYYDAGTPAVVDCANIVAYADANWTSTASTQNARLGLSIVVAGTMTQIVDINSRETAIVGVLSCANSHVSWTHDGTDRKETIAHGGSVTEHTVAVTMADDAYFDLPANSYGWMTISVEYDTHAEVKVRSCIYTWSISGVTEIIAQNGTTFVTTDTDGNFCAFDNGTSVRVRNRLGSSRNVIYSYHYSTDAT